METEAPTFQRIVSNPLPIQRVMGRMNEYLLELSTCIAKGFSGITDYQIAETNHTEGTFVRPTLSIDTGSHSSSVGVDQGGTPQRMALGMGDRGEINRDRFFDSGSRKEVDDTARSDYQKNDTGSVVTNDPPAESRFP